MKQIPFIAALTVCTILALGSLATAISVVGNDLETRAVRSVPLPKSPPVTVSAHHDIAQRAGVDRFDQRIAGPGDTAAWTPFLLCSIAAAGAAVFLRRATA